MKIHQKKNIRWNGIVRREVKIKTVIVYASVHHGNTKKLVEKIAEECKVDLIDAVQQPKADLADYDRIGFASGIYFSKFHQTILKFASENLPENKKVFLICTYGGNAAYKSLEVILKEKKTDIIGKFGCKGYDTFGPFKLVEEQDSMLVLKDTLAHEYMDNRPKKNKKHK